MSYIFLIITLVISIINIDNLFKKPVNKKTWILLSFLILSTIVSFILQYRSNKNDRRSESVNTDVGVLQPATNQHEKITWILGGVPFLFFSDSINIQNISFNLKGKKVYPFEGVNFTASVKNNKLEVNTTIRDSLGNVIIDMEKNEWHVNRPQFAFDRNFNDTAIEVIDNMNNIVFQIELSANKMTMNARFVKPDGQLIMAFPLKSPSYDMPGISGIVNYESGNYKLASQTKFRPLFKYPSALHPKEKILYTSDDLTSSPDNIPPYPKIIKDESKNYIIIR